MAVSLAPVTASAHDLWVVSGRYRLAPHEVTRVFINSGDVFPESLTLVNERRVERAAVYTPDADAPVSGLRIDGKSLSFEFGPRVPGSHVLAVATRPRRVRLRAREFESYLEESGLESIQSEREELGETDDATLELYSKFAKAFVDVTGLSEPEAEPKWSLPVGHRLELIPGRDPNALRETDRLSVRVLYDGEPLADVQVVGGKAGVEQREIRVRTDDTGTATVSLSSPGRWYLRAIHMVSLDDDPEAQWESFWSTVTFEVRGNE